MPVALRVSLVAVALLTAGTVAPHPASAAATSRYRVSVSARPSTVLPGRPVQVAGQVGPAAPGRPVRLQVLSEAGWRTVAVVRLGARSRFRTTYTPPGVGTYLLRVRKPSDGHHRAGTSASVTVTVTPSLPPT